MSLASVSEIHSRQLILTSTWVPLRILRRLLHSWPHAAAHISFPLLLSVAAWLAIGCLAVIAIPQARV